MQSNHDDILIQSSEQQVLESCVSLECWAVFLEKVLPAVDQQVLKNILYLVHIIGWMEMQCDIPHSLLHLMEDRLMAVKLLQKFLCSEDARQGFFGELEQF